MAITIQNPQWNDVHNVTKIEVTNISHLNIAPGMFVRTVSVTHCDDRGENEKVLQLNFFTKNNDASEIAIYGDN